MLTGIKRRVQEACLRKLDNQPNNEGQQEELPPGAVVFTFTQPLRNRTHVTMKPKPVTEVVASAVKPKYASWEQEAFSRFFRRESNGLDLVVRHVYASFACDWFYIESLYPIMRKYNMMPRTTLPLITCQYPLLEVGLPEMPWGYYFPYFESNTFDHGHILYRLSPRFQLVMQGMK